MTRRNTLLPLAWGLALGSSVWLTQYLYGTSVARWQAVALMVIGLADVLARRASRSGWWIARGVDSENLEPCWLVKGGPYSGPDDTVAELGSWWQARRYIARMERLTSQAYRRNRASN